MKKCPEEVSGYCRKAIQYKKYAEIRKCNKCCRNCQEPCSYICSTTIEMNLEE